MFSECYLAVSLELGSFILLPRQLTSVFCIVDPMLNRNKAASDQELQFRR